MLLTTMCQKNILQILFMVSNLNGSLNRLHCTDEVRWIVRSPHCWDATASPPPLPAPQINRTRARMKPTSVNSNALIHSDLNYNPEAYSIEQIYSQFVLQVPLKPYT